MRVALALAACLFLIVVLSIARRSSPTFPVSDDAVGELATLNAVTGQQLLGPYSRYPWHHPGPALFYALAPFYALSNRLSVGMAAGAVTINVAALATIVWVLFRRNRAIAVAFGVAAALYFGRLGELLASPWNAHAALVPASAVVVIAAAVMSGAVGLFPLFVALASFALQTHIATLPVVAVGGLLAVAGVARHRERSPAGADHRKWRRAVNLALLVTLSFWLVPLIEQMLPGGGNLTRLWRFATGASNGAAPAIAIEAWADMMTASVRDGLATPSGLLMTHDGVGWAGSVAAVEVLLLPLVAWWAHRRGERLHMWLAVELFVVSVGGLWAVSRIPDGIHEHEVFWLSAVGLLNVVVIAAAPCVAVLGRRLADAGGRRAGDGAAALCLLLVGVVAVVGVRELKRLSDRSLVTTRNDARVERATRAVEAEIARAGARKPKILIDQRVWEAAAGVILQLRRRGVPVAVEPGLERMFSGTLAADGSEDLEITFCGGPCHERLTSRPGNTVVLLGDGLAIDAIRLSGPPPR